MRGTTAAFGAAVALALGCGVPEPRGDGAALQRDGGSSPDAATGPIDASADALADAPADAPADAIPEYSICPGALPEQNGLTLDDLERVNFAGYTEIYTTFCNPLWPEPPDRLLFFVEMNDHSGIPPSDLRWSQVTTSDGALLEGGLTWEGTDLTIGEHHAGGMLAAPLTLEDGTPILGPDTTWLQLNLIYIGDDTYQPFFRWEKEYLP